MKAQFKEQKSENGKEAERSQSHVLSLFFSFPIKPFNVLTGTFFTPFFLKYLTGGLRLNVQDSHVVTGG